jgi:hypothetical protein
MVSTWFCGSLRSPNPVFPTESSVVSTSLGVQYFDFIGRVFFWASSTYVISESVPFCGDTATTKLSGKCFPDLYTMLSMKSKSL